MPKSDLKNILIVVNPISGGEDKEQVIQTIKNGLEKVSISYQTYTTTGQNDYQKLESLINSETPDIVIAIGGDGTVNMVARTIINKNVKLGIVPLGSANGLSKEFNIPTKVEESIAIILENNHLKLDAIKVNEKNYCFHLGDVGMNAKIIERFEKEPGRGMWMYVKNFLSEIIERETHYFKIKTDDRTIDVEAHMVAFANARQYGTGAILNSSGKPDDGKFEVIIIKPFNAAEMLLATKALYDGTFHELEFVEVIKTQRAILSNAENQQLQIDGELLGKVSKANLEIVPNALNLIVPSSYKSN